VKKLRSEEVEIQGMGYERKKVFSPLERGAGVCNAKRR